MMMKSEQGLQIITVFSAHKVHQSSRASRLDSFQGSSCKAPQAQRAARFKGFRVPRPGFVDRFKSLRESYRPMFVRKHICGDFPGILSRSKIFRDSQRELESVFFRREQLHGTLQRFLGFISGNSPWVSSFEGVPRRFFRADFLHAEFFMV